MANSNADFVNQSDEGYQPSDADMLAAQNRPKVGGQVGVWKPDDPNKTAVESNGWTNTQTGQHISGQLTADGKTIIAGFAGGNPSNTNMYDVQTGKNTQADPHPWLDVAKNAAMIFGPSYGAALALGLAGGGAGAAGAGSADATSSGSSVFPGMFQGVTALDTGATGATTAATGAGLAGATSAPADILGGTTLAGTGTAAAAGGTPIAALGGLTTKDLINLGGGVLQGIVGQHNTTTQQGLTQQQIANQLLLGQQQQAQAATQLNPLTQLQGNQRQALAQMLLKNMTPSVYNPPTTPGGAGSYTGGIHSILGNLQSDLSPYASMFSPQAASQANADFQSTVGKNPQYATPQNPWSGVTSPAQASTQVQPSAGLDNNPADPQQVLSQLAQKLAKSTNSVPGANLGSLNYFNTQA